VLFGIHPATAVGTDLFFAAATKSVGTLVHGLSRTVRWGIVGRLACGSVPATVLTLLVLSRFDVKGAALDQLTTQVLACSLLLTAAALIFRQQILNLYAARVGELGPRATTSLTVTQRPQPAGPVHLVLDSTGLELFGQGEWDAEKYGRARRQLRKLYLTVDAGTGEIARHVLTEGHADDAAQMPALLGQVEGVIASVVANGVYDGEPTYATAAARQPASGDGLASLRQRGSLTVWFTDDTISGWAAEPGTTHGGQSRYSPLAILTALTLRTVFRLAYRQAEGLIGCIVGPLSLSLRVPDHTTSNRRAATLDVPRPGNADAGAGSEPMHLLVDSTGRKLCGRGEWLLEKHGTATRRSWRVLHLDVDAGTGRIVKLSLAYPASSPATTGQVQRPRPSLCVLGAARLGTAGAPLGRGPGRDGGRHGSRPMPSLGNAARAIVGCPPHPPRPRCLHGDRH
jgi:hypothetical protein